MSHEKSNWKPNGVIIIVVITSKFIIMFLTALF